jgi:hypothetical protein
MRWRRSVTCGEIAGKRLVRLTKRAFCRIDEPVRVVKITGLGFVRSGRLLPVSWS